MHMEPDVKHTVVIIDDDSYVLKILENILADKHHVKKFSNCHHAKEYLAHNTPALVLLDVIMPETNGYEMTKFIKQQSHLKLTKVILLSGRTAVEDRIAGYEAGAQDYISKPFDSRELQAKVNTFLSLYDAEKRLAEANNHLEEQIKIHTEQAIRNEKMALIGMHASEIVHNLNNPLTLLIGSISSLKEGNTIIAKDITRLSKAADKIKIITSSILDSARNTSGHTKTIIDINSILRSEIEMMRLKYHQNMTFSIILDLQEVTPCLAVANHLTQVFSNLIQNAIDAMFSIPKQCLTIKTSESGDYIKVEITDTGTGMSEQTMSKIFEPLFTTKTSLNPQAPKGTGLGLPSVKRMVEDYKGYIEVDSTLGVGTTFSIFIPFSLPHKMILELKSQMAG